MSAESARRQAPTVAYAMAESAIRNGTLPPGETSVWLRVMRHVDRISLRLLAEDQHDPFPFVPFLAVLGAFRALEDSPELQDAEERLRREAGAFLEAQGLELLRPDDVMAQHSGQARELLGAMSRLYHE